MLYKFKSKVTGDLIMLEPNGRQILTLIGKDSGESLNKGILLPQEMPAAIVALQAAIAQSEAAHQEHLRQAQATGETPEQTPTVSLRQRALPFIDMLQRCHRANKEVVWGV
ncbi:MAG: DUF1840 domain-containing protein [Rhodoferax sp.]|nr:DUF1840 domain-containing protein [Rhodoferax sp.]